MLRALICLWLCLAASMALAQDAREDEGYLTGVLQDLLSDAGRDVRITGFSGALSSEAQIERLSIADADGVWLELEEARLVWRRSALAARRVEVERLTAARLVLHRRPVPPPEEPSSDGPAAIVDALPSPKASEFRLPRLPVAIQIGDFAIEEVVLSDAIIGEAARIKIEGRAALSGEQAQARLSIDRLDDPGGRFGLDFAFDQENEALKLDLELSEPAGGLAARLLDIPDHPALRLNGTGEGPLDDWRFTLGFNAGGIERVTANARIQAAEGGRRFNAALNGDLAPLLAPDYAAFLGDDIELSIAGQDRDDGRLVLSELRLSAAELSLTGGLVLAPSRLPERIALTGVVGVTPGRTALPFAPETRFESAELAIRFDATRSDAWQGAIRLRDLDHPELKLTAATLIGDGTLDITPGAEAFDADLTFKTDGVAARDRGLADVLGRGPEGSGRLAWRQDGPFLFQNLGLRVAAGEITTTGAARFAGRELRLSMMTALKTPDLSRLRAMTGLDALKGQAELEALAFYRPLSGAFELTLSGRASGLRAGLGGLDPVLASGPVSLEVAASRGLDGLRIPTLTLANEALSINAEGRALDIGADVSVQLDLANSGILTGTGGGPVSLRGQARERSGIWSLDIAGDGRDLRSGQDVLDQLLVGRSDLAISARVEDGTATISQARLASPQLSVTAEGDISRDTSDVTLDARLTDLGLLVSEFPGPARFQGQLQAIGTRLSVDAALSGPGGTTADLDGSAALAPLRLDLGLRGSAPLALANPFIAPRLLTGNARFDLTLNGPPTLSSLAGLIELDDGLLSDPALGRRIEGLRGRLRLAQGRVFPDLTAKWPGRGDMSISGALDLAPPFVAALQIDLSRIALVEPGLFETRADGSVSLRGPLTGAGGVIQGSIRLGDVEARIPDAAGGASAPPIPTITHQGDSAATQLARQRAGVSESEGGAAATGGGGAGSSGGAMALDLAIIARDRVFLRGRGVDAEFGGRITFGGTVGALQPAGGFDLIRGRINLLGQRLELTEGRVRLLGDLSPEILLVAETSYRDGVAQMRLEGPADALEISFSASPELPEDEIIAQIFFGVPISELSAFQIAQIAGGIAALTGGGTDGPLARIRRELGLDDLDLTSDEEGRPGLRAGAYASDEVYTEVEIEGDGTTELTVTIDLGNSVTLRGRSSSDGDNGIGLFFERDY